MVVRNKKKDKKNETAGIHVILTDQTIYNDGGLNNPFCYKKVKNYALMI